jgi:hypothetical protein
MNTKGLAKMYDQLTPEERLPLILAASIRGDEAEKKRLARSAPTNLFRLPDYHALGEGILLLSLFHTIELLDLVTSYWRAGFALFDNRLLPNGKESKARGERLLGELRMLAYLFTVEADAWKRLCAEMNMDAEFLLKDVPGYPTVARLEETIRITAFTPEEATAFLRKAGDETAQADTVDTELAMMHEFLNSRAEWWS